MKEEIIPNPDTLGSIIIQKAQSAYSDWKDQISFKYEWFNMVMELLCKRRNNYQKETWSSNFFFQLESPNKNGDRVSL